MGDPAALTVGDLAAAYQDWEQCRLETAVAAARFLRYGHLDPTAVNVEPAEVALQHLEHLIAKESEAFERLRWAVSGGC